MSLFHTQQATGNSPAMPPKGRKKKTAAAPAPAAKGAGEKTTKKGATGEKKEPDWRKHPAKQHLKKLFKDKIVSVEYSSKGGPRKVWDDHCKDHPAFSKMKYNETFTRRLRDVKDDFRSKLGRAEDDKKAYENFRKLHPVATHNHRGEPRWEGSRAQELLREDMDDGIHDHLLPAVFRAQRPEYQDFQLDTFRDHIYQEQRLRKYHNWLEQEELKKAAEEAGIEKKSKKQKTGTADDMDIDSN